MMAYLQDGLVTAVALWAGLILFRRVSGFARPKQAPGCAHCPTAAKAQATGDEHPLIFIKASRH